MRSTVIQYASVWARILAWLVYVPPFGWIGNMQSRVSGAVLKQVCDEYDAKPISVALIVRAPQRNLSPIAIPSGPDGSK